jgi:hypothetical protein
MSGPTFHDLAERELKYQARREISKEIRNHCPKGDPMVTGAIVMLGTVLAMAVFSAIISDCGRGRTR